MIHSLQSIRTIFAKDEIDFSHFLKSLPIVLRIKSELFPWPKRPYKLWHLSDIILNNFPIPRWAPPTVYFLLFKHTKFIPTLGPLLLLFPPPGMSCLNSFLWLPLLLHSGLRSNTISRERSSYLPIQSRIALLPGYFPVGPFCFFSITLITGWHYFIHLFISLFIVFLLLTKISSL